MGLIEKSFLLLGKQSCVTPIGTLLRANIKMERKMAQASTGTLLALISTMAVGLMIASTDLARCNTSARAEKVNTKVIGKMTVDTERESLFTKMGTYTLDGGDSVISRAREPLLPKTPT